MEDEKRKRYEAPMLTLVIFKAEKGYANSELNRALGIYAQITYGTGDQNIEDRGAATEWSW